MPVRLGSVRSQRPPPTLGQIPASADYLVETLINASASATLYVESHEQFMFVERVDCVIAARALSIHVYAIVDTLVQGGSVPGTGRLRLRMMRVDGGMRCEAIDESSGQAVAATVSMVKSGRLAIEGVSGARFEYWAAAWSE